jgi:putative ubiquitin-RnfH superfamily antitoxin RatB of RatAB toxin-antitoxin module
MIGVEVIRAWPRRFESVRLQLADGACLHDAVEQAGWAGDDEAVAYAIHGQRVTADTVLRDGDRVELLRPLVADPKDARRRRAGTRGA